MSATDPGITDTCLYMMATPTDIDGSDHNDPTFWLSPNVFMKDLDPSDLNPNAPNNPNNSFAKEGVVNTTNVVVNWKAACQLGEIPAVQFDLYVSNPAMTIVTTTGTNPGNSVALATGQSAGLGAPGTSTTPVTWTPGTDPNAPNGSGHKCLIARCYPAGMTPDPLNLSTYVETDKHYVQHNLTIDVAPPPHMKMIRISTGHAGKEREQVIVNVLQDFQPSRFVLDAIMPSLRAIKEFKKIGTTPVRHMSLDFGEFRGEDDDFDEKIEHFLHVIADKLTGLFGHKPQPNLQTKVTLPPGLFADVKFNVDVSGSTAGDAHIFHLTQADSTGHIEGGVTVVVVAA